MRDWHCEMEFLEWKVNTPDNRSYCETMLLLQICSNLDDQCLLFEYFCERNRLARGQNWKCRINEKIYTQLRNESEGKKMNNKCYQLIQ